MVKNTILIKVSGDSQRKCENSRIEHGGIMEVQLKYWTEILKH